MPFRRGTILDGRDKQISRRRQQKAPLLCVGPIGKDGSLERKHSGLLLHALIKHVLMADEFGYAVKRADEDADPGMIGDRVVSDIIDADLVIADLTDLNANAFYELGIRHSTEKPTIHVAKAGTALPFDTVAHRTIFVDLADWHSLESARERLANSAEAIKSPDYKVSNPITQANASFKMRQSEDPRDRVLAAIQERLDAIESERGKRPDRTSDNELFQEIRRMAMLKHKSGISSDQVVNEIGRYLAQRGIEARVTALRDKDDTSIAVETQDGIHINIPLGPPRWTG
jgi:hypothetical protein